MILIAHRGNLNGRKSGKENTPDYIDRAIDKGFHVEIDVWGKEEREGELWLGHDTPDYSIDLEFIRKREEYLWVHCKCAFALHIFREHLSMSRYFFHQSDDYTLTSDDHIWCYPGKMPRGKHSVVVLPETIMPINAAPAYCQQYKVAGVCSDYISTFQKA